MLTKGVIVRQSSKGLSKYGNQSKGGTGKVIEITKWGNGEKVDNVANVKWENGGGYYYYYFGDLELVKTTKNMTKYYKVVKDHPLWEVGAILSNESGKYVAINELHVKFEEISDWGDGPKLVEQSDFFQRVYPVNLLSKTVYKLKDEAREYFAKEHVG